MGTIFDKPGLHYVSHRGFRPLAPDNSLPSFEYAGLLRQWAIETDVQRTDGKALGRIQLNAEEGKGNGSKFTYVHG